MNAKTNRASRSIASRTIGLLAAGLLTATSAYAARTVNDFVLPTCPLDSAPTANGDVLSVSVTGTTNGGGSADNWESTRFTWTDTDGNQFSNCSNDPNFTSDVTNRTANIRFLIPPNNIDYIAPAPEEGYDTLTVEAFANNNCSGPGSVGGGLTRNFPSACRVDVPNEDLEPGCDLDIILILDESGSIATANARQQVMQGARSLVDSVNNTGSRIALIEFSNSSSRFVQLPNQTPGNYVAVTDATIADFFDYLTDSNTPTGASNDPTTYSPSGNTPWDLALMDARTIHTGAAPNRGPADLVVKLTDGNPTNNSCNLPGDNSIENVQCAVQAANALKAEDPAPHMFVVAVGGGISIDNIQMISGLDRFDLSGAPMVPGLFNFDYTEVPFSDLEELFRRMFYSTCAPSLTVTKMVDPDGPDYPDLPAVAQDFEFVAEATITEPGQASNDYEWVDPPAATNCPTLETGVSCPGPGLAGNVGATQTGWTDTDGTLSFSWIPNTVAEPEPWSSQIRLSETIASPYFFREMNCERRRLDFQTGQLTTSNFTCLRQRDVLLLPDGTPAPDNCENDPSNAVDECAERVVCGDLDVDTDTTIELDIGDIMACQVVNDDVTRLPVTLNEFHSQQAGSEIVFEWETASETELLGFKLWALVNRQWVELDDQLVLAGGTESAAPQSYSVRASTKGLKGKGRPRALGLSAHDFDGTWQFFGPLRPGARYGERISAKPIDWDRIRGAVAKRMSRAGFNRPRRNSDQTWVRARPASVQRLATTAELSDTELATAATLASTELAADESSVYNLLIEQSGMYRVTYEQLLAAGLDLNGVPTGSIAVTSRGEGHARQVEGNNGVFGPGGWIAFFGEALTLPESLYTYYNTYQIQVAQDLVRDAAILDVTPAGEESVYQARVEVNEQNGYTTTSPSGDPWYDTYAVAYPGTYTDINVTVPADRLVAGQPATLELGLWGMTSFTGDEPDHHVLVLVNGSQVADEKADGLVDMPLEIPLDPGVLVEGENAVTVRVTGETGYAWDAVALDSYALVHPREFVANGYLQFDADGSGFKVTNLVQSASAYAWQDATLTRITELVETEENGSWSMSFAGLGDEATYWVGPANAMRTPEIAPAVSVSEDLMAPADLLIIAHPFFKERLINPGDMPDFVAAKEAQGYSVAVKDLFEIYQAYGYGLPLPFAIQAYLREMAQTSGGFKHALLVGGSTRDPRNYEGPDSVDFIPTWYEHTGQTIYFTPTDVPYGDFEGDIVPEKMVARWPVRTDEELDLIIQKSLDWYDNGLAFDPSALLIADAKDPAYAPFSTQLDRVSNWLGIPDEIGNPTAWEDTTKVYLDDYFAQSKTVADARADMIARINDGVAMTLMSGHGSYSSWTNDGLLNYQHVSAMTNAGQPTLITPLSCYTTYFVPDSTNTLGHHLLLEGDWGAVAIQGATAISSVVQNEVIAEKILKNLVHGGMDLGEAILQAKQELNPGHDTVLNWALLGDPTLKMPIQQP